ncbi:hypothetical protein NCC49_003693 [Naganishia albida]|nr:hypothetical protein NCC49_003693 [Naganishia albida]
MDTTDMKHEASERADVDVVVTPILLDDPDKTAAHSTSFPASDYDFNQSNSAVFASLTPLRKNLIYTIISLALAVDLLNTWGLFTAIDKIARDVGLEQGGNAVWIVSAYAVAFAACIPLGGRLCDVLPVQWWFTGGFAGMACLNLGNSFVRESKAFLALRALQGICGALTLPAGFSMIVKLYPNRQEQQTRLIGISVILALGAASGFFLGALLSLAHWRWIFRFLACTSFAGATAGWLLLPKAPNLQHSTSTSRLTVIGNLLRRLDLFGVVLVMSALLLFNLALTSATVYGWDSPRLIVPIVLAAFLFPSFCWWEASQDERYAMLPVAIMKEPKFLVVCYAGVCTEMWFTMAPVWSTTAIELGPSRFFQEVLRDPPIIVAGKLSVICVGCFTSGLVHTFYIGERVSAKHRLLGGIFLSVVPSLVLLILSDGGKGLDFWRYICPAFFVGAFAMCIVLQVCNVLIIQSVPAEYSGVGSSVFQMCSQTGIVIGSAVQAAIYTAVDNDLTDWRGHQYGFYYMAGCLAIAMVLVGISVPRGIGEVKEGASRPPEVSEEKVNDSFRA